LYVSPALVPASLAPLRLRARMLVRARSLAIVLGLALSTGCAWRDCCAPGTNRGAGQAFDCRAAERHGLTPDVAAVSAQTAVLHIAGDQKLCALAETTAQCLAATHATIANLLIQEAAAVRAQPADWHVRGGSSLTSELLELEATQKRNTAAGDALEVFLRLVEAEAGVDNLQRRGQAIDSMLDDIARFQQRGLLSPVSKPEIEGQRLELWHKQVELRATVDKLNAQLQELLGVELARDAHFWPETSLAVSPDVPDKDESVSLALANRGDLAALRLAAAADGPEGLVAARAVLRLAGGGLGTPPAQASGSLRLLLHVRASSDESAIRSQQVGELLADRERVVRHETLLAVAMVETRLAQIGLTRRRMQVAGQHLEAAVQQQRLTDGAPWSVRKARLEAFAVEQDLLHDVIEWKLAVVKLKQAEGLLAVECGYDQVARMASGACCR
jgi:hypothetical protein